jgi:hypothetical protein
MARPSCVSMLDWERGLVRSFNSPTQFHAIGAADTLLSDQILEFIKTAK